MGAFVVTGEPVAAERPAAASSRPSASLLPGVAMAVVLSVPLWVVVALVARSL